MGCFACALVFLGNCARWVDFVGQIMNSQHESIAPETEQHAKANTWSDAAKRITQAPTPSQPKLVDIRVMTSDRRYGSYHSWTTSSTNLIRLALDGGLFILLPSPVRVVGISSTPSHPSDTGHKSALGSRQERGRPEWLLTCFRPLMVSADLSASRPRAALLSDGTMNGTTGFGGGSSSCRRWDRCG